ncbi:MULTISPECIES: PGAP1-like alpha/beta domain-containing protein [unclassified Pseudoalteromonas]|uniref:PGAP1-like alpha/beta domain-containing protein n=1 Tax=unclassified Pseudoalteromonas TaxID=194690 RepID=UPI000CF5EAAE|nr:MULTISPECIES: alpha/beta hydrolase [unclassified Pseudoalteromonas]
MITKVVVLHGLYMSGFVMRPLCARLQKHGYDILNLSYNTLDPNTDEIFARINAFIGDHECAFVCHSLGGLIARRYLSQDFPQADQVKKVFTLGTPHKGAKIVHHMQQKGMQALLKNSLEYLASENQDWPFNAKLYSIAGDLPLGLLPLFEQGHPCDGTVKVDETKLNGMAQHKVFHLSHTSLIYSRKVVAYILEQLRED